MAIARVLVIAGSDSGGGAGIQADIKTIAMLGGHAMTAITAITAQNTRGVSAVHAVPAKMVIDQIGAIVNDLGVDAIKIGMIGSAKIAAAVAERLEYDDLSALPLVFDPVMVATSGALLADAATIAAFERIMAAATLITPNLPELVALTGFGDPLGHDEAIELAGGLAERTGTAVLLKGGHWHGAEVTDYLFPAKPVGGGPDEWWSGPRINTIHDHGTGCTLASGIATGLAQGMDLIDAIARAREYVRAALRAAPGIGGGHGPMGHALGVAPFDLIERLEGEADKGGEGGKGEQAS